jgi:hypothetical protein
VNPDAVDMLVEVESFLLKRVLEAVPAAIRSDVRAAIKGLVNCRSEFDSSYGLLSVECQELAALCQETDGLSSDSGSSQALAAPPSLTQLTQRHAQLLEHVDALIASLQARDQADWRERLRRIYLTLGEQGQRRLRWQSVFTDPKLISQHLRETWPEGAR